jgi:hypothetical protein
VSDGGFRVLCPGHLYRIKVVEPGKILPGKGENFIPGKNSLPGKEKILSGEIFSFLPGKG